MGSIVAAIIATLPGVALRIVAPLLTQELAVLVGRRVLIAALRKFAAATRTPLDDQIVEEFAARLGVTDER